MTGSRIQRHDLLLNAAVNHLTFKEVIQTDVRETESLVIELADLVTVGCNYELGKPERGAAAARSSDRYGAGFGHCSRIGSNRFCR